MNHLENNIKMIKKNYILLLSFSWIFLFAACNGNGEDVIMDLETKKDKLREKKQQLRNLQTEIESLESAIEQAENGYSRRDVSLVGFDTLQKRDLRHFTNFQGNIETRNQVMATAELSGRIVSLNVSEGQSVQRGQLIATLDTEVIDRQMAEVETTLDLARDVYARQKRLWDQNIGSEIQYLEAKNSVDRLERSLEVLETQKSRATINAPQSGIVEQLVMRQGEIVSPGMPVAIIVDNRNLKLVSNIPENFLAFVQVGDEIGVELPSLRESVKTRISRIGSTIDQENRTFVIEANMPANIDKLKPNLMARVSLNDRTVENTIVIPLRLVQYDIGGQAFVYVAKKENDNLFAEKRMVKTGLNYRNDIEIKEGLEEGDLLIIEGQMDVANGQMITTTPN
ncbi:MAG: efflux RND transporter periplasmic adaptor subunit [Saprospirales bacterium]|nr:MAG: efflux RND transporter periplasmic adaptor subunit [Saprospirales bacterium]